MFELRASQSLFCTFFDIHMDALSSIVNTLGPFSKAWKHSYHKYSRQKLLASGGWDLLFDPNPLCYALEWLVSKIVPKLTADETTAFFDILRGALQYESSYRFSAKQITKW